MKVKLKDWPLVVVLLLLSDPEMRPELAPLASVTSLSLLKNYWGIFVPTRCLDRLVSLFLVTFQGE